LTVQLQAVVFDVDGTLVDSERHGHRVAFNRAFEAFELPYTWNEDLYGELLHTTGGQRRIDGYLAGQGVPEAERDELAPALHKRKTEILEQMVDEGAIEVRPGAARLLDEQQPLGIPVGMQYVGARTVTWDLWGADLDESFADLRKAAVGGDDDMLLGGGGPPVF